MVERYVRLDARGAEEAYLQAKSWAGSAGSAIDAGLLFGVGPAVVAALDELGPVFVLAPISGPPRTVGAAVERLVRLGASWVTVAATAGGPALQAAVEAAGTAGCRVAVETVPVGIDTAAAAALFGGPRGKQVSRLAALGAGTGVAGVVCSWGDLGVVAQVAPDLTRILDSGGEAVRWGEAAARGAGVLVLPDAALLTQCGDGGDPSADPPGERAGRR
jgi:hypothetical protein